MERVDRLEKINYQYRKPAKLAIHSNWAKTSYIAAAQSALNAQIIDTTIALDDSVLPQVFLETALDWRAGVVGDTVVKIGKEDIYVIQDLSKENLGKHQFVTTPNIGLGYFGKSYMGGAL